MDDNNLRQSIYQWIKLDAPLTVQLVLIPEHVEDLIKRIKDGKKKPNINNDSKVVRLHPKD